MVAKLAAYSGSRSIELSCASIFESPWKEVELYKITSLLENIKKGEPA
jgi:hypothetical protein